MFFQIGSVIICYHSTKFTCKVLIQITGFALPINLATPVLLFLISLVCRNRENDPCYMTSVLPKEVFWEFKSDTTNNNYEFMVSGFWTNIRTLLWLGWWTAQFWITIHLWTPKQERLVKSEK